MASSRDRRPVLAALKRSMTGELNTSGNGIMSPTDSEIAENNLAALERQMNETMKISNGEEIDQARRDPLFHDAAANTRVARSNTVDSNYDPLSVTALESPLHTLNWDAILAAQGSSIDGIVGITTASSNHGSFPSFKRAGPHYPPSMEKMIMDYHHRHSKSWQLVHDLGAGSGVYSPTLAKYFRHVHVSDPDPAASATSRRLLSTWAGQNRKSRGRFTFSTAIAERGHESMADGTADMVIVMEGAHFADPTALVLSAAESLASNGTLALVSYSPVCRITGNPRADAAAQKLFTAWGDQAWNVVCGDSKGKQKFSLGLDFVPIPLHLFHEDKTRRITINSTAGRTIAVPGITPDISESRARKTERRHDYTSEDEQAKGWRQEVGPEFFRSLTTALLGTVQAQQYEENFKEIAQIVQQTSPNGIMINVEWNVAVVLATKK